MHLHFDRNGEPISPEEWSAAFGRDDRTVARTSLGTRGEVSTVWLGLDASHGDGPPLIFETMMFGGPMHALRLGQYSTEEGAKAGHQAVLNALLHHGLEKRPALIHNGRKPRK
jgi:hypothetical protein